MTDLIVVPQAAHWQRLKRLVLDSVSSPITKRVYNLGLDEFFDWYGLEARPAGSARFRSTSGSRRYEIKNAPTIRVCFYTQVSPCRSVSDTALRFFGFWSEKAGLLRDAIISRSYAVEVQKEDRPYRSPTIRNEQGAAVGIVRQPERVKLQRLVDHCEAPNYRTA
jgi:hypothetical protein